MPTRGELIAEALDLFLQDCSDVEGAAVVSVDGLPMASALPMHFEEDRLAAMTAALLSLGEKAAEGLGRGSLGEVHIEGDEGTVHLMSAGPQAVFCAICRSGSKTGLVLFEMRGAADRVARALAAPQPAPAGFAPASVRPATPPVDQRRAGERPTVAAAPVQAPAQGQPADRAGTPASDGETKTVGPVPDLHPVHGPVPAP